MYLINKYSKWYNNIVVHAKSRILPKDIYTERHHIIPKSLGGADSTDNLVTLTAREHFICHLLLIKMVSEDSAKRKMQFALNSFRRASNNQQRHKITSFYYEFIRKEASKARSGFLLGNQYNKGRKASAETKAKQSAAQKSRRRKPLSESHRQQISNFHKGKVLSEETKQKMRKTKSAEHCENIRKANLGKIISDETKKKISEARLGQVPTKKECPHCGKMFDPGNYAKHLKRVM